MKFYHDTEEQYKPNISKMIGVHYNRGYGLYFRLKETILNSPKKRIVINNKTISIYSKMFDSSQEYFIEFINDCINIFNLFILIEHSNGDKYLTLSDKERKDVID